MALSKAGKGEGDPCMCDRAFLLRLQASIEVIGRYRLEAVRARHISKIVQ